MKILSRKRKYFLVCRQLSGQRSLIRRAGKRKHKEYLESLRIFQDKRPVVLSLHKCIDLIDSVNRGKLTKFVKDLEVALRSNYKVVIDFGPTEHLETGGTLYLIANIDTLLIEFPGVISCRFPKNDVVEQLLQHVGLLRKLGKDPRKAVTADNVVNWHFATGSDATTSAFKALLMQHSDAMGGLQTRSALYDCMSEAVTNTRKHAYVNSTKSLNNWWMFSQANEEILTVTICDLGIGIPKSLLVKPQMRDYFRKLLMVGRQSSHDKELIKIATSTNRSSTGLEYRGKGLPQMLEFIKETDHGGFRALSGSGGYTFNAFTNTDRAVTYRHPIKGTLVQWTLKLKS